MIVSTLLLLATGAAATALALGTHGRHDPGAAIHAARPHSIEVAKRSTSAATHASATATLVRRLSIAQLAGQRIIYSYSGLTPPSSLLARIRAGEAAGVIFFATNVSSTAQLRAVIGELLAANAASPVHAPLLMLTDQEGGLVRRLPGAPQLSERQIGEHADATRLAARAGASAGANLASVGINVNLAPVLDVYRRPGDFIDEFQRSYGTDPSTVAALGAAFVVAQQRTGVAATAKHFPGLGAAESGQDTDVRPVTLDIPLHELRSVDERPYRAAIAAGVRLVMLSWAVYPALDPGLPAGLSPAVIQGELRRHLGFRGVTVTDALGAGALQSFGTLAERGVLAARAGADLLICALPNPDQDSPAAGISVLQGLTGSLMAGRLSLADARQADEQIIALRADR